MAELVPEGKYDAKGKRVGPDASALPFQTVETVNESLQEPLRGEDRVAQPPDLGGREARPAVAPAGVRPRRHDGGERGEPLSAPTDWDEVLERAVRGLRAEGATEVSVFGSVAEGVAGPDSDLDLAVRGIAADRWHVALGRALRDVPARFSDFLVRSGRLRRVA